MKEIEVFNELSQYVVGNGWTYPMDSDIKQMEDIVMKGLKALEIIKRLFGKYDYELVKSSEDGKPIHLLRLGDGKRKWLFVLFISRKEYELLKEVLG